MSTTRGALNRSWRCFATLEDIVQEVREWRRRTEKVALTFVALFRDEELCLRFGLDAFGNDAQTERVAKGDRCATYGARLVIVADFFDERAIDHDAVER
jgi:hypothetical protein